MTLCERQSGPASSFSKALGLPLPPSNFLISVLAPRARGTLITDHYPGPMCASVVSPCAAALDPPFSGRAGPRLLAFPDTAARAACSLEPQTLELAWSSFFPSPSPPQL